MKSGEILFHTTVYVIFGKKANRFVRGFGENYKKGAVER